MNPVGPAVVYPLCLATSLLCATLLVRSYRRSRTPLLLWSAVAFGLLAVNNLIVVADMLVFRSVDLAILRLLTALAAVSVLIYAFVWELD